MRGIALSIDIYFAHYIGKLRVWQKLSSYSAFFFAFSVENERSESSERDRRTRASEKNPDRATKRDRDR